MYYVALFLVGAGWNLAHVSGSVMVINAASNPEHAHLIQSKKKFMKKFSKFDDKMTDMLSKFTIFIKFSLGPFPR